MVSPVLHLRGGQNFGYTGTRIVSCSCPNRALASICLFAINCHALLPFVSTWMNTYIIFTTDLIPGRYIGILPSRDHNRLSIVRLSPNTGHFFALIFELPFGL